MFKFLSKKHSSRFHILKITIALAVVFSITLLTAFIVKSNTATTSLSELGTLTIRVRTTEIKSDTPYIFRIESTGANNTNMKTMRLVLTNDFEPAYDLDGKTLIVDDSREGYTPLQVYETTAAIKLYEGNYKIELPSDSRWRYGDIETCYNKAYNDAVEADANQSEIGHPDNSSYPHPYQTLVWPHQNFRNFSNNRIEIYNSGSDDITVIVNLTRINERWLTSTYITEGYTN